MSVLETVRLARMAHRCSRCRKTIAPGEHYVDARIPPGADVIGTERWQRLAYHVGAYGRRSCA